MKIGIVGLKGSGKTTLFKILTNSKSKEGSFILYDKRIEELSKIFNPKKITHAYVEIYDVDEFNEKLTLYDLFIFVIRNSKELNEIKFKLILSDLKIVEKRLENAKKRANKEEYELFSVLKNHLENEEFLYSIKIEQKFQNLLKQFNFITQKPFIVLYNVFEGEEIENLNCDIIINLKLYEEALSLNENEREEFLKLYNFDELNLKLVNLVKEKLGIILFFTAGEKEVRSWILRKGQSVKEAAGKIHSDLEKGFIRAEVISYEDFMKVKDMKIAKEKNLIRIEGKDYIVNDGDIIYIRSSI